MARSHQDVERYVHRILADQFAVAVAIAKSVAPLMVFGLVDVPAAAGGDHPASMGDGFEGGYCFRGFHHLVSCFGFVLICVVKIPNIKIGMSNVNSIGQRYRGIRPQKNQTFLLCFGDIAEGLACL